MPSDQDWDRAEQTIQQAADRIKRSGMRRNGISGISPGTTMAVGGPTPPGWGVAGGVCANAPALLRARATDASLSVFPIVMCALVCSRLLDAVGPRQGAPAQLKTHAAYEVSANGSGTFSRKILS